jgi:mevalonate kinase
MAIDRCAQSVITADASDLVSFDLLDFQQSDSFTLRALSELKSRVLKNYHMFLNGELSIREVLRKPVELFEFAFINILDGLHLKLAEGVTIQTSSNIPIGCGMGSSAATILSALRAAGHYFRVEFRPDWYLKYSLEAEKLQHGFPSGVDSYISLHGGCAIFENGQARSVPLPRLSVYLVNTGTPSSTTGECVVEVRRQFQKSGIWDEFEAVTREMEKAVGGNRAGAFRDLVQQNHRLLCRIGVVPRRVQDFIADVEKAGGVAKVCGAGSVAGDQGGIVMVAAPKPPADLCARYGYTLMTVRGDPLGTRIV